MKILHEARQRGVLKVATVYLGATWLVMEIGHTLFNVFELPHLGLQLVFILMALGLPFVLAGAWYYRFGAGAGTVEVETPAAHHGGGGPAGVRVAAVITALLVLLTTAIGVRFFNLARGDHGAAASHATAEAPSGAALPAASGPAHPFEPPAHSIAVLPFVNMSGDPAQDYFSDGLSEELLNSLARIDSLEVAARTSSFAFKGQNTDVSTVAHKLNVGTVLEGSVRKAGNRVRITAQLINAQTGYHLWSQTYDRDLNDILSLQTDVAQAVTSALQVALLGSASAKLEFGGTRDAKAFDFYLRATSLGAHNDESSARGALTAIDQAIAVDGEFALAHALRAVTLTNVAMRWTASSAEVEKIFAQARDAAQKSITLAPELGEAHAALALVLSRGFLDATTSITEVRRALDLAPGSADVQRLFAEIIGRASRGGEVQAIAAAQRAVHLDPLSAESRRVLIAVLASTHHYEETLAAYKEAQSVSIGKAEDFLAWVFMAHLGLGQFEAARTLCESTAENWYSQQCLAVIYAKLGRQADAQTQLAKLQKTMGETGAFQYAEVYAQWGDKPQALHWLEVAYKTRDSGLSDLPSDPVLDPIRGEPQFVKIAHQLKLDL